jgi:hypothetical protein
MQSASIVAQIGREPERVLNAFFTNYSIFYQKKTDQFTFGPQEDAHASWASNRDDLLPI